MINKLTKKIDMPAYMEMGLCQSGKDPVYLRIPTLWDEPNGCWMGFIQTPKSKRMLHATGADSFTLQNNFNVAFQDLIKESTEMAEELLGMFMPAWYWEKT